jgi:hypothetical protein
MGPDRDGASRDDAMGGKVEGNSDCQQSFLSQALSLQGCLIKLSQLIRSASRWMSKEQGPVAPPWEWSVRMDGWCLLPNVTGAVDVPEELHPL